MRFDSLPIPWEQPTPDEPRRVSRAGMLVDLRRCIGCHGCSVSCKTEHEVPLGSFRTRVHWIQGENKQQLDFVPMLCMHCEKAPCLPACSNDAISRHEDGRILIDENVCEGLESCIEACPYDAISIHPETGLADKCDLCQHRTEVGMDPACVEACPTHALQFGDLDDPEDPVAIAAKSSARAYKEGEGTAPQVVYLGHEDWMEEKAPGVQLGGNELGIVYEQSPEQAAERRGEDR